MIANKPWNKSVRINSIDAFFDMPNQYKIKPFVSHGEDYFAITMTAADVVNRFLTKMTEGK